MPEYLVTWKIDIDCDTPEEAAREALAIMQDKDSIATVFEVKNHETGEKILIDLYDEGARNATL